MSMPKLSSQPGPIGVFDSGYGGLTVLKELQKQFPNHRFIYLGDNARAPYGTRSFDTIYQYTLEAVNYLFAQGCHLVIVACNTASARALRTIQQRDLPQIDPNRRVLGIIRPMTEHLSEEFSTKWHGLNQDTQMGTVGILGTRGTVESNSYVIELEKFIPKLEVLQKACPMWVPLVENREVESIATDYFIDKYLSEMDLKLHRIEILVLACTHYPVLRTKIEKWLQTNELSHVEVLCQGKVVASKLADYLTRHPEMNTKVLKEESSVQDDPTLGAMDYSSDFCLVDFQTTETVDLFNPIASHLLGSEVNAKQVKLS